MICIKKFRDSLSEETIDELLSDKEDYLKLIKKEIDQEKRKVYQEYIKQIDLELKIRLLKYDEIFIKEVSL